MKKILAVYHSETGHTKDMAKAIAKAAGAVLKDVNETRNEDLLKADAIAIGSPTYFRQMSWNWGCFHICGCFGGWKEVFGIVERGLGLPWNKGR